MFGDDDRSDAEEVIGDGRLKKPFAKTRKEEGRGEDPRPEEKGRKRCRKPEVTVHSTTCQKVFPVGNALKP